MENKEKKKVEIKNKIIKVTALLGLFLLVFGISYALFSVVLTGTKKNKITTGTLSLKLTDLEGNDEKDMPEGIMAINLENAYPMTNEEGLELESYEFKVVNDGSIDAYYKLKIEALETTDLPVSTIRYNLVEDGETITIEPKLLSNTTTTKKESNNNNLYQIDTDIIKVGEEKTYKLNLWIDYEAENEAMNKTFEGKLEIEGSQITSTTNVFKEGTLAYTILNANKVLGNKEEIYAAGFNSSNEESGLYAHSDMEGGTTYYYRGTEVNNYVSFGGFTWRIVRVLEDGSVRLILNDKIDRKTYKYNSQYDDPTYLKYSTSEIKTTVDNWYNTNLTNYDKFVTTSTYCSDTREDASADYPSNVLGSHLLNVYGYETRIKLGSYDMSGDKYCKDEECEDYDDAAETEDLKNMKIKIDLSCREEDKVKSKAALLSADEFILSGGTALLARSLATNNTYLIFDAGYGYYTMSPARYYNLDSGQLSGDFVNIIASTLVVTRTDNPFYVIPTITLKSQSSIISGKGISTDPYVIG
ncbi:MAG: hypothetical protein ACI4OT_03910 [Bacilli bacterium]